MIRVRWIAVGCAFGLLASCAKSSLSSPEGAGGAWRGSSKSDAEIIGLQSSPSAGHILLDDEFDPPDPPQPSSQARESRSVVARKAGRLLVRNGMVRIATSSMESSLDQAEQIVQSMGGYTESRLEYLGTFRVPVDRFDDAFDRFRLLGRVLEHRRSARDVTDEFQDLSLRIGIKKRLLDKLQDLLALETDRDRRRALLEEIRSAAEDLERLQRSLQTISRQAAFSILTLKCEPIASSSPRYSAHTDLQVFRWINSLEARNRDDRSPRGERLPLAAPSGMVELPKTDSPREWRAASPDGTEFRARSLPNELRGDARFWREAIRLRLGPAFAVQDTFTVGPWQVLRLVSSEPRAWSWWLATSVEKDRLHLAQAYIPDSAQERRDRPALEDALRKERP
ncbi:MAG: DUF4349 domain-containing protein [Fibrobacteria bacterium]|nr:DUF4349 domain-containing protein [Fibrobacteria bacterium]